MYQRRVPIPLNACDVDGEEVDAVAVEVAAGAVIVLGGAGVGVTSEDLGVAEGNAGEPPRSRPYDTSGMTWPFCGDMTVLSAQIARDPGSA
jgi:hypothetical protein